MGEYFLWYRLTWVVPDKMQSHKMVVCVCVCKWGGFGQRGEVNWGVGQRVRVWLE